MRLFGQLFFKVTLLMGIAVIVSGNCWAGIEKKVLYSHLKKAYPLHEDREIHFFCEGGGQFCDARKIIAGRKKVEKLQTSWEGQNPASGVCRELSGTPETLMDSQGNESAVCVFQDHSFMVTWEYIHASTAGSAPKR